MNVRCDDGGWGVKGAMEGERSARMQMKEREALLCDLLGHAITVHGRARRLSLPGGSRGSW